MSRPVLPELKVCGKEAAGIAQHLQGVFDIPLLGGIEPGALPQSMVASGIASHGGIMALFSSHPPIAERIRRYEDMGLDCLMLQFHPMREGLETFAREIMPAFK